MSHGAEQPVYDIFVSYAHVNNQPPPPVADGGVTTFVETILGRGPTRPAPRRLADPQPDPARESE